MTKAELEQEIDRENDLHHVAPAIDEYEVIDRITAAYHESDYETAQWIVWSLKNAYNAVANALRAADPEVRADAVGRALSELGDVVDYEKKLKKEKREWRKMTESQRKRLSAEYGCSCAVCKKRRKAA